jgi:hypothetical protein
MEATSKVASILNDQNELICLVLTFKRRLIF